MLSLIGFCDTDLKYVKIPEYETLPIQCFLSYKLTTKQEKEKCH